MALVFPPLLLVGGALAPDTTLVPTDLVAASFAHVAAPGVPYNRSFSDVVEQLYPYVRFLGRELREGRMPLWNPFVLTGVPFLAATVPGALFPFHWLAAWLHSSQVFDLGALSKLLLGGFGVYSFLTRIGCRPLAAVSGAWCYVFSGYYFFFLLFPNTWVAAFLPWALSTGETIALRWSHRPVALLAVIVAMMAFAGHVETAFLCCVALGLYVFVAHFHAIPWILGAGVLGGSLAAVQLLPFLENLGESATLQQRSFGDSNPYYFPWSGLPAILVPNYLGSPVLSEHGDARLFAVALWIGPLSLGAACLACWVPLPLRRRALALTVVSLFALAICFGIYPVFHLFTSLPLLRQGNHTHMVLVFQAGVALLAGLGIEAIERRSGPSWAQAAIILGWGVLYALLCPLAMDPARSLDAAQGNYPLWSVRLGFPWLLVILGLLLTVNAAGAFFRSSGLCAGTLLAAALVTVGGWHRTDYSLEPLETPPPVTKILSRSDRMVVLGIGTYAPDTGMLWQLRDARGYESVVPSGLPQVFGDVVAGAVDPHHFIPVSALDHADLARLRRLGVTHLVSPIDLNFPGTAPVSMAFPRVYRIARSYRVHWATRLRVEPVSLSQVFRTDSLDTIFLAPPLPEASRLGTSSDRDLTRLDVGIRWLRDDPDVLAWEVEPPGATGAWFVLRDRWFPGWAASLDGRPVQLVVADRLFRAVFVPPGRHRLEMRYAPWSVRLGLLISLIGALGLVAFLAFGKRLMN
ncbi:MAG: hypothetical protein Kow00109_19570 [Acidobacteriota bacterium]